MPRGLLRPTAAGLLAAMVALVALVLGSTAAIADPDPDPGPRSVPLPPIAIAIASLREHPPVYSSGGAPLRLNALQKQQVAAAIAAADARIYIAVLPGSHSKVSGTARQLRAGVAKRGTYLAVVGTVYDTFSTELNSDALLTRAFAQERDNGTTAVMVRFAELVGQQTHGTVPPPKPFPWAPTLIGCGVAALALLGYAIFQLVRGKDRDQSTT